MNQREIRDIITDLGFELCNSDWCVCKDQDDPGPFKVRYYILRVGSKTLTLELIKNVTCFSLDFGEWAKPNKIVIGNSESCWSARIKIKNFIRGINPIFLKGKKKEKEGGQISWQVVMGIIILYFLFLILCFLILIKKK